MEDNHKSESLDPGSIRIKFSKYQATINRNSVYWTLIRVGSPVNPLHTLILRGMGMLECHHLSEKRLIAIGVYSWTAPT